jgi:murein DD-endopeptidase MepM/ murein hydrolase activator NlpD
MAISSPILNDNRSSTKAKRISVSENAIKNIQQTLIKQGTVRREILDRKKQLRNQRREQEQRQRLEDELEASSLVIRPSGPIQMIQSSTKGFLERIVGFLGYLSAGWLMNNLPTWIAMGKEFIGRVQRMGQLIGGFVTNITNIFTGFGNLLSATFQNLIQFDLFDSSNRVKDAFGQLTGSIDDMGRELEEAIRLITTPLTEGMVTGEDAPATGTQRTDEGAYEPGAPLQAGGAPSGLFELIAGGEGGYESVNRGDAGDSPGGAKKYLGKNLQDMTLSEIMSLQSQRKVFAVGKYQIVTGTMPGFVRWLESKGYNPKTTKYSAKIQDLYPQYTIESKRPQVGKFLSGSMNDIQKANLELAAEFASVGVPFDMKAGSYGGGYPIRDIKKGESLYSGKARNRASISPEKVQQALKQARESGGNIAPSSPQRPRSVPSQSQISSRLSPLTGTSGTVAYSGKEGSTLSTPLSPLLPEARGVITSGKGYRSSTQSYHRGYDIGASTGTPVYAYFPGTVTRILINGRGDGGYGHSIEWRDSVYGQTHFFAHLQKAPTLAVGKTFDVNAVLGHVGGTGYGNQNQYAPHLHWEIGPRGKEVDPGEWLRSINISQGKTPLTRPPEPQLGSRDSSGKFYTGRKYGYQSWESAKTNRLLGPEILGDSPSRVPSSVPPAAQIASAQTQQQRQQISQQLSQDRTGPTVIFQQPPEPEPQGPSYSAGGTSMMPLQVDEFTLVNNFMKKKLLLDLAYL